MHVSFPGGPRAQSTSTPPGSHATTSDEQVATTEGISILIVDDHTVAREGLRAMLQDRTALKVVGEAMDGLDAVEQAAVHQPQVVLMDYRMPGIDGIEATRRLKYDSPHSSTILMSIFDDALLLADAILAGANGYLVKSCTRETLLHAIYIVVHGYAVVDAGLLRTALQLRPSRAIRRVVHIVGGQVEPLTGSERELLQLVAEGRSNREIAAECGATEVLVKRSLQTIAVKLHARNRTHAAVTAIRLGII